MKTNPQLAHNVKFLFISILLLSIKAEVFIELFVLSQLQRWGCLSKGVCTVKMF